MEMDLGSTIIGAIAIIICALPFVMIIRGKKKKEKAFLQSISKIAVQNNCQITQHDILGNFAIGIDETNNFVFFFKQLKDKHIEQFVDLNETQSCKVVNKTRNLANNEGNQVIINKLELSFTPFAKNKTEIKMEFFNADVSIQLNGELQLIEKWSKLINDRLNNKK